ncbi:MAG: acyl-CoA thioesterase [Crocinitomicaceae bacterium]|jgi:acyl-CoA thioester hydrolase|nr:acyl-CoA thioesterase [Crocinitomicaceae bacterium]MBT6515055.1 acyl-CoA thioesterase [Crocinitomicaceae bacterium]
MFYSEIKIRVRYAETDQMGYCYYGNYAQYFEVGRVEALRTLGVSYKDMEIQGVLLPVTDYSIKYLKPAFYDENLKIKTTIKKIPGIRIEFEYETYNEKGELINTANTKLVFLDKISMKPRVAPDFLMKQLTPFFNE